MRLRVERGVGGKSLIELGEVAAHARAIICERTARVDEGNEQHLAAKLSDVNQLAVLVKQLEIGTGSPRLRGLY